MKEDILEKNGEFYHFTVMKNEVANSLNCIDSDKIFVDCTLGGGGHSEEILKRISKNKNYFEYFVFFLI